MKPLITLSGVVNMASTILHAFRLRLLKGLLAFGSMSIAMIWIFENSTGRVTPLDRVAYPTMLAIFALCGILLLVRPNWLESIEWLSFGTLAAYVVLHAQPLPFAGTGIYTDASLSQWFPLVYAAAFFFLETRYAIRMSILIYLAVLIPNVVSILLPSTSPQPSEATLLLINTLFSHPVYIVTLSGIARLKTYLVQARAQADAMNAAANIDYLTGIANRRALTQSLQQALVRAQEMGEVLSVILIDLDYFKQVNDNFGHDVGDRALIDVTGMLRQHLRATDVLGRWGGEEFVVITHATGSDEAAALAERLRSVVADHPFVGVGQITISLGVATSRSHDTPQLLVKRADDAMYQAKQSGRNCVRIAPPQI